MTIVLLLLVAWLALNVAFLLGVAFVHRRARSRGRRPVDTPRNFARREVWRATRVR